MTTIAGIGRRPVTRIEIVQVATRQPLEWLRCGREDFVACLPVNVAHGLLMAVMGWVLLMMLGNHPYFVAAAVSGFLLIAPLMTTGLLELSRRRGLRQSLGFDESVEPLKRHARELFRYGGVLALLVIVWFVLSELTLRAVFDLSAPSVAETYYRGFLDVANFGQIVAFIATGAVLAVAVLAISVVTVPLIIDRKLRAGEAIRASMRVTAANPRAMLVWSALIVAITMLGFATLLLGMAVLIPWLGHATWHAYRDLVR